MKERLSTQEIASQRVASYGFRFEQHIVRPINYERKRSALLESIRSVFKLGENNVFLIEEANATQQTQERFDAWFSLYGSFRKALICSFLIGNLHKPPSEIELENTLVSWNEIAQGSPGLLYRTLILDALDTLKEEGYRISLVYERGKQAKISFPNKAFEDIKSSEQKIQYLVQFMANSRSRNQQIVYQLIGIEKRAEKMQNKTNIFTVLGTHHTNLLEMLPNRIRERIMYASSEPDYQTDNPDNTIYLRKVYLIIEKLERGEKVSPEEWRNSLPSKGLKNN